MPSLKLGLGLWQVSYQDIDRLWLRWYDAKGNWMSTPAEEVLQERQRAEQQRHRAEGLAAGLRELGVNPDEV
jgi:hypothetical protein